MSARLGLAYETHEAAPAVELRVPKLSARLGRS